MDLNNEFTVSAPVAQAWAVLTDLERIAPCMPGAELQEIDGDEFRGIVKVKVGPITAQYKGTAKFLERDDANHRAVIRAEGRDTRGQGNASATITATLTEVGGATHVSVVTDLTVTGKVAQFGRGVMADVSAKLMGQFVQSLEADVLAAVVQTPPEPMPTVLPEASSNGPRKIESKPAQPVDLLGTAGSPVAKRVGPAVGVLVVVLWLLRRRRKKKRQS